MTTGWYIFCGFLVLFGILGLISLFYNIGKDAENKLLNKMFENNDISATTYKKYKK